MQPAQQADEEVELGPTKHRQEGPFALQCDVEDARVMMRLSFGSGPLVQLSKRAKIVSVPGFQLSIR